MTREDIIRMARQATDHLPDADSIRLQGIVLLALDAGAADEREACVKECKKLFKVFLSSEYATGQPLSSFKERHAVAACIESIEARGTHETN